MHYERKLDLRRSCQKSKSYAFVHSSIPITRIIRIIMHGMNEGYFRDVDLFTFNIENTTLQSTR